MPKILLCLAAALSLAGCRSQRGLLSYVPADTVALAGIRVDSLKSSPSYRKLEALGLLRFDDIASSTGVDPRRDVSELLLAGNGKHTVMIARGRIELKNALPAGYRLEKPEPDVAVAGPEAIVRAALEQRRTRGSAGIATRAAAVRGDSQIWGVTTGGDVFFPVEGNASNLRGFFRLVKEATFSADLRTGLHALAIASSGSEPEARKLADAVRGVAGLSRLAVPNNRPDLLRLYDGIKVDQQGATVRVEVTWAQNLVDALLELAAQRKQP